VYKHFLFYPGLGDQDVPSNQKSAFFTTGISFNDLINLQKRLIHNYNYVQCKLVHYFL
jgi:hypothetical protein